MIHFLWTSYFCEVSIYISIPTIHMLILMELRRMRCDTRFFFVPLKLVGSRKTESNQLEIIFDFYNVKTNLGNLNEDFQQIFIDWTLFKTLIWNFFTEIGDKLNYLGFIMQKSIIRYKWWNITIIFRQFLPSDWHVSRCLFSQLSRPVSKQYVLVGNSWYFISLTKNQ